MASNDIASVSMGPPAASLTVRMPDFLVIGAPRSGTTTLYEGLRRHPDIFMPSAIKEPSYFLHHPTPKHYSGPGDGPEYRTGITSFDRYRDLFAEAGNVAMVGEASTIYLGSSACAQAIHEMLPSARLVAILRHPADRAYSQFQQHVQQGREPLRDFAKAIAAEDERMERGWSPSWQYVGNGFYGRHLSTYFNLFPREQIRIFLYEDLEADLPGLVKDVYGFLGVDTAFEPRLTSNINASGQPRSPRLHGLLYGPNAVKRALKPLIPYRVRVKSRNLQTRIINWNLERPASQSEETRRQLVGHYADDIRLLESLIDRDLSAWLR